jgi:hypothetical protein
LTPCPRPPRGGLPGQLVQLEHRVDTVAAAVVRPIPASGQPLGDDGAVTRWATSAWCTVAIGSRGGVGVVGQDVHDVRIAFAVDESQAEREDVEPLPRYSARAAAPRTPVCLPGTRCSDPSPPRAARRPHAPDARGPGRRPGACSCARTRLSRRRSTARSSLATRSARSRSNRGLTGTASMTMPTGSLDGTTRLAETATTLEQGPPAR